MLMWRQYVEERAAIHVLACTKQMSLTIFWEASMVELAELHGYLYPSPKTMWVLRCFINGRDHENSSEWWYEKTLMASPYACTEWQKQPQASLLEE